jgi:fumarate hydratase class II
MTDPSNDEPKTHLEDATPLTVGQEWSGYAGVLRGPARAQEATAAMGVPIDRSA